MSNVKRTLSALLAVVMVFTTMTVAFTVIGSAAPTVPRTVTNVMNPNVQITVPQYLETYGTDYYQRGSNVKAAGNVFIQITTANGAEVKDVALACSDTGISLGTRIKQGQDGYSWAVNGGTLKTAPSADGSSMVKWTFTYQVNGIAYTSEAWTQVKPLYNNPGFSVYLTHNNSFASHATENYHIEWIQPLFGNEATSTDDSNAQQCYINTGARTHVIATGPAASSYYWRVDRGSTGGNRSDECGAWATGTYYVDTGNYSDLSETPLQTMVCRHNLSDEDGNHPFYYEGSTITGQTLDGAATNAYSITITGETKLSGAQVVADSYIGAVPTAGHYAIINTQIKCEGNVTRSLGITATSSHTSTTHYSMAIISYDKTDLATALATATAANYQASQFMNTTPSGVGSGFRTWDQYYAALQWAWYIYGRQDVSNEVVQAAASGLNAALPKYNAGTGAWVSGMKYGSADYSRIDSIIATIPETLVPDFYTAYSDGTYGKYYQYSYASALVDALEDIAYDRPLDSRYQSTVDQMRVNLSNAINNVEGKTKMVSVEFVANQTDVRNVPSSITTTLIGSVQKPATDPSKSYYRFTGWYYDEACTQAVTWPMAINYTSPY
ncbi:MAG: hypothetical protein IKR49_09895, partial [Clostridia bacterium]|nr:hypothetical protein [Clostridia bacterium]